MKPAKDEFLDPIEPDRDGPTPAPGEGEPTPSDTPPQEQEPGERAYGKDTPELQVKKETIALRQARDETKTERKARQDLEARYGRLEANTNKLLERLFSEQQPKQPEAPVEEQPVRDPNNPKYDPIGHLHWQDKRLDALDERFSGRETQERTQSEQQEQWQTALNQVNARWVQQSSERPELNDAYQHTLRSYAREFAANGAEGMLQNGTIIPGSPIDQALKQHEATVIAYCYQNNIAIEDYLVNIATARGWKASEPQLGAENGDGAQQNGDGRGDRSRDPATGKFVKMDEGQQDRAASLAASQNANRSLSQGSGAPTKKMGAKELAEMTEEEMWAEFKKHPSKQFDREMNFR